MILLVGDLLFETRCYLSCYNVNNSNGVILLGDNEIAYELIKDIEPTTAQEYILKAIANAVIGQERNSVRHRQ